MVEEKNLQITFSKQEIEEIVRWCENMDFTNDPHGLLYPWHSPLYGRLQLILDSWDQQYDNIQKKESA